MDGGFPTWQIHLKGKQGGHLYQFAFVPCPLFIMVISPAQTIWYQANNSQFMEQFAPVHLMFRFLIFAESIYLSAKMYHLETIRISTLIVKALYLYS